MNPVVITPFASLSRVDEQDICKELFAAGLERLHLRKPEKSRKELAVWLDGLDDASLKKTILHSHYELSHDYRVGGIHLTEEARRRRREVQAIVESARVENQEFSLSASFHDLSELCFCPAEFEYVFMSPIFDSISKPDLRAGFPEAELVRAVKRSRNPVFALGGIDASKIARAAKLGFQGVALLGAIWENEDPVQEFLLVLEECRCLKSTG